MRRQLLQFRLLRTSKLSGSGYHRQNFALLRDQEPLELTCTNRRIKPDSSLIRDSTIDFGGDRVEAPHTLDSRGMRTGECFRERTVGVGGYPVLSRQRGLPFRDGTDRPAGLLCHPLTVLRAFVLNNHRRYPTGRLICTPEPSGLIRTVAPACGASTTRLFPIANWTCPALGKTRSPGRTWERGTGIPSDIC